MHYLPKTEKYLYNDTLIKISSLEQLPDKLKGLSEATNRFRIMFDTIPTKAKKYHCIMTNFSGCIFPMLGLNYTPFVFEKLGDNLNIC